MDYRETYFEASKTRVRDYNSIDGKKIDR